MEKKQGTIGNPSARINLALLIYIFRAENGIHLESETEEKEKKNAVSAYF